MPGEPSRRRYGIIKSYCCERRIRTINKWLLDHGYDVEKLWSSIDDVMVKTIISAHEALKQNYRTCFLNHDRGSACFEILGFDVLLDRRLKPYVLEVNYSSFMRLLASIPV